MCFKLVYCVRKQMEQARRKKNNWELSRMFKNFPIEYYRTLYLFIHNFMTTYTYTYIHVPMERTNIGNSSVQSIGTCIYLYVYVVMKL